MGLPYYKRYTRDILDAFVSLSGLELRGAYGIVIDLIYHHDGKLPDESRYICGYLDCTPRKWSNIKNALMKSGKIHLSDGYLTNNRAIIETKRLDNYRKTQSLNGKKAHKTEQNGPAVADTDLKSDTDTDIEEDEDSAREIRTEWKSVLNRCIEAARPALVESNIPLMDFSRVRRWLEDPKAPCDLERDILPALEGVAAKAKPKSVRGWGYFEGAVIENRDARLSGLPAPVDRIDENEQRNNSPRYKNSAERNREADDEGFFAALSTLDEEGN